MIQEMIDALQNPAMKHAALVHLPIALATLGVPFALATAIFSKSKAMRWTAVILFAVFAMSAFVAAQSGEDAEHNISVQLPAAAEKMIHEHEELAEKVWMFAAGTCVLVVLSAFPAPLLRRGGAWLAVLAAVFTACWVTVAAHHGGSAVYQYAAGTANPMTANETPAPTGGGNVTPSEEVGETASDDSGEQPITLGELSPEEAFFVASVQPILETSCQRCHNPRRARRSGGLDQTTREAMLMGGNSGPGVVPGKPDDSLIIMRVTSDDEDLHMPPGDKSLTAEQIEALRTWIENGAAWVEKPETAED